MPFPATAAAGPDGEVFELASVSKQFAATGILMLVDAGKIKLSDSLRKFFPGLPYSGITSGIC
jgi:CubicO group peptidase (beta-lactamase class C family)